MYSTTLSMVLLVAGAGLSQQTPMASDQTFFSAAFKQPQPPMIKPEFQANFNQHKWNKDVSHITSGFIYSSPTLKKIRVDQAYEGVLGSSLFDFGNATQDGVANTLWELKPSINSPPAIWQGFVQPTFPLFSPDYLIQVDAVFAGHTTDPFIPYAGNLTKWNLLYNGLIPATVLLDADNVVHGFDYSSPGERTGVITRYFNIVTGDVPEDVFDFPRSE